MSRNSLLCLTLIGALLAGCTTTTTTAPTATPTSAPASSSGGGSNQLRASLRWDLRHAGVPEACIQQLSTQTLAEVKGLTSRSARTSRDVLIKRQRIRAAASKDCPGL